MHRRHKCSYNQYMSQVKILLVQLASLGDCLLTTAIAKQIKESDYPGCHLTWLIGSHCSVVLDNNPFVDEVITIPVSNVSERQKIAQHIEEISTNRSFNKVFVTDFTPENNKNHYGTTRSTLVRNYGHPLKGSPQPILVLSENEIANTREFCKKHEIDKNSVNILFECGPLSGQSDMTFERALLISERLVKHNSDIKIILSSKFSFDPSNPRILDGSELSWRENAELANYCQLIVGCSSGISWLCTSSWIQRPVKFIQAINFGYPHGAASMQADYIYWGLNVNHIIEMNNPANDLLEECIALSVTNFKLARKKFNVLNDTSFLNPAFINESRLSFLKKMHWYLNYFFGGTFFYTCYKTWRQKWYPYRQPA